MMHLSNNFIISAERFSAFARL